ncbi:MAG: tyrosine-type recombinase/integrase [Verrucomicrobiales bacterium]
MSKKLEKLSRVTGVAVAQVSDGRWRVRLGKRITGDSPIEKRFGKEAEAVGYIEDWLQMRTNRASAAASLSDSQLEDARHALQLLEGGGFESVTLTLLAESFLARQPSAKPWTVEEACGAFRDDREKRGCSDTYLASLPVYHKHLIADMGEELMHEITAEMLEEYLDDHYGLKAPKTYNNNLGHIKALWAFGKLKKRVAEDVAEGLRKRKEVPPEVGILSPSDLFNLLETCKEIAPELLTPFALQAFAGLRRSESLLVTWGDLANGQVNVSAKVSKTSARRSIPILPPLQKILDWAEAKSKPKDKKVAGGMTTSQWEEARKKALRGCDITWPKNCLRHSFVSYRLADLKNDARVALEAGHTAAMLHRHYKGLVTEGEAKDYWDIYQENITFIKKDIA